MAPLPNCKLQSQTSTSATHHGSSVALASLAAVAQSYLFALSKPPLLAPKGSEMVMVLCYVTLAHGRLVLADVLVPYNLSTP